MSLDLWVTGYPTLKSLEDYDIEPMQPGTMIISRSGQHEVIIQVNRIPPDVKFIKIEVSL